MQSSVATDSERCRSAAAASRCAPDRRRERSREAEARAWAPEGEPHASHENAAAAWFAIVIAARVAAHLARRREERGARPAGALKGRGIGNSSFEAIASLARGTRRGMPQNRPSKTLVRQSEPHGRRRRLRQQRLECWKVEIAQPSVPVATASSRRQRRRAQKQRY